MKFLFSASLPCSKRRRERRAEESAALCRPPWMSPSNASYPSRRKYWETWETFIFNTAFPNLITSAIRRCCHENELAEGRAGVVTCSVCLGRPEDGKETLLELAWNSISFFFSPPACGKQVAVACVRASVRVLKKEHRDRTSLCVCLCVSVCVCASLFSHFPHISCSSASKAVPRSPSLHGSRDPKKQGFRERVHTSSVCCESRALDGSLELVGKRWSHTQTERWEAAHGLV